MRRRATGTNRTGSRRCLPRSSRHFPISRTCTSTRTICVTCRRKSPPWASNIDRCETRELGKRIPSVKGGVATRRRLRIHPRAIRDDRARHAAARGQRRRRRDVRCPQTGHASVTFGQLQIARQFHNSMVRYFIFSIKGGEKSGVKIYQLPVIFAATRESRYHRRVDGDGRIAVRIWPPGRATRRSFTASALRC